MPLILNGADTSKLTHIFDRAPEIGCVGGDSVSGVDLAGPRFLNTYLPLRLMPRECLEKDCKVIMNSRVDSESPQMSGMTSWKLVILESPIEGYV